MRVVVLGVSLLLVCGCGPSAEELAQQAANEASLREVKQRRASGYLEAAKLSLARSDYDAALSKVAMSLEANETPEGYELRAFILASKELDAGDERAAMEQIKSGLEKCPGSEALIEIGIQVCDKAIAESRAEESASEPNQDSQIAFWQQQRNDLAAMQIKKKPHRETTSGILLP